MAPPGPLLLSVCFEPESTKRGSSSLLLPSSPSRRTSDLSAAQSESRPSLGPSRFSPVCRSFLMIMKSFDTETKGSHEDTKTFPAVGLESILSSYYYQTEQKRRGESRLSMRAVYDRNRNDRGPTATGAAAQQAVASGRKRLASFANRAGIAGDGWPGVGHYHTR